MRPEDKDLSGDRVRGHGLVHGVLLGSEEPGWGRVNAADRCPVRSTLCGIKFRSACARDNPEVTCLTCLVHLL